MPTSLNYSGTPTQYVPADLRHDTNGWYIIYYIYNPIISALERKRIRLNQLRKRCSNAVEFRVQASNIMHTINSQLVAGAQAAFSAQTTQSIIPMPQPVEQTAAKEMEISTMPDTRENIRYYTPLESVIDIYLSEKKKEARATTFRSYNSFCKMFKNWVSHRAPGCMCVLFKKELAIEFIDMLNKRNDISPRTYNNNIKLASSFFTWCVKKCYAKENPFMGQHKKRELKKKRTIIPSNFRSLIDDWFADNNPAMRIVMRLVYTSLLRPVEISRVQVNQIDFRQHCIHMPGDKTKNWEDRDARMDAELEALLRQHIAGADPEDYIFADKNWVCGKEPMVSHSYSNAWAAMRKQLLDIDGEQVIPDTFQLYSLKDTAINGMIKEGVDDLSVMQAAGHHDLKMTLIYANHTDTNLIDKLNQTAPKF